MFVHFGLYSKIGRGEWVMNREQIPPAEMEKFARSYTPDKFNADELCDLAVEGGMKYIVFTTMHHDGFRLYDTALTDYNSAKYWKRDLVQEIVEAARKRGLKIGLYHSLNNWHDQPDAVAALESKQAYNTFIEHTFERIKELVTRFNPIDILWYDGWWPFHADGWQGERMNAMVRAIQPHIIFNGRNGLPGDFGTPEQHLTAPSPWRPWEACMTLNQHWGFHISDHNWKSPVELVQMLLTCANGNGNLLLNVGPKGNGSIPARSASIIRTVGKWLERGGREAITDNEIMKLSPFIRKENEHTDWDPAGSFTASGKNLFFTIRYCPGKKLTLTGIEPNILQASIGGYGKVDYTLKDGKLVVELPAEVRRMFCPVLKLECDGQPSIYRCGGMRVPKCEHPRYDPVKPDIIY